MLLTSMLLPNSPIITGLQKENKLASAAISNPNQSPMKMTSIFIVLGEYNYGNCKTLNKVQRAQNRTLNGLVFRNLLNQ